MMVHSTQFTTHYFPARLLLCTLHDSRQTSPLILFITCCHSLLNFTAILAYIKGVTFCFFYQSLMKTTAWFSKQLEIIPEFWLVKFDNRSSMSMSSHKGFFSYVPCGNLSQPSVTSLLQLLLFFLRGFSQVLRDVIILVSTMYTLKGQKIVLSNIDILFTSFLYIAS